MRKYRNMTLISLLTLVFLSTFSCTTDTCGNSFFDGLFEDDSPESTTHTSTTGTAIWNTGYTEDSNILNLISINNLQTAQLNTQQYLLVELQFDMTLSQSEHKKTWHFPSLIQNAYACSPVPTSHYYNNIEDIIITSEQDFNALYPAGSNLNNLFEVTRANYNQPYNADGSAMSLTQYLTQYSQEVDQLSLQLTQRPALDIEHTFNISYSNALGNSMLFISPSISFVNE